MPIPRCGYETQEPPVTAIYFESRWNLNCRGITLGIEFDPVSGDIKRIHYDDPGMENEGWCDDPEAIACFPKRYPKTARAVQKIIDRLRQPLQ